MIEELSGIRETINYTTLSKVKLYHNDEYEDYPPHWHVSIEMILPTQNSYKVIVNNTTYTIEENQIAFINSGVIHSLVAPPTGERTIIQFDLSLIYSLKELNTILFMLSPVIILGKKSETAIYDEVYNLIKIIINEYDSDNSLKEVSIYSYLIQIFVLLGRNKIYNDQKFDNSNELKQQEYIQKFLAVCDYINNHIAEQLTLEDMAAYAGFSKYHFARLFKKFTNATFCDYLNGRRVAKAESLLLDANLNITTVAMNSGFSSISTFNRIFKNVHNCSPTEYRDKKHIRDR